MNRPTFICSLPVLLPCLRNMTAERPRLSSTIHAYFASGSALTGQLAPFAFFEELKIISIVPIRIMSLVYVIDVHSKATCVKKKRIGQKIMSPMRKFNLLSILVESGLRRCAVPAAFRVHSVHSRSEILTRYMTYLLYTSTTMPHLHLRLLLTLLLPPLL